MPILDSLAPSWILPPGHLLNPLYLHCHVYTMPSFYLARIATLSPALLFSFHSPPSNVFSAWHPELACKKTHLVMSLSRFLSSVSTLHLGEMLNFSVCLLAWLLFIAFHGVASSTKRPQEKDSVQILYVEISVGSLDSRQQGVQAGKKRSYLAVITMGH